MARVRPWTVAPREPCPPHQWEDRSYEHAIYGWIYLLLCGKCQTHWPEQGATR